MSQPQPEIKKGTVWRYRGPGDGRGILHYVTSVADGEVTTWSQPFLNAEIGGHSWLGDAENFRRSFTLVA